MSLDATRRNILGPEAGSMSIFDDDLFLHLPHDERAIDDHRHQTNDRDRERACERDRSG